MQMLRRLARLEVAVRERTLPSAAQWATALADFDAKRESGVPIDPEEELRFTRIFELLDIARARRDKALGIRRKSRVG
jgi:hypothetical protein